MSKRVERTCPCGVTFEVPEWKIRAGRGKRCSKACQYKYATRPSGLTYEIKQENKAWFKEGEPSWLKDIAPEDHPWWKGDEVGYSAPHKFIAKRLTKTGICQHCNEETFTQWANKSHEYRRDLDDWLELCRVCHRAHDSGEFWGVATKKFKGRI